MRKKIIIIVVFIKLCQNGLIWDFKKGGFHTKLYLKDLEFENKQSQEAK